MATTDTLPTLREVKMRLAGAGSVGPIALGVLGHHGGTLTAAQRAANHTTLIYAPKGYAQPTDDGGLALTPAGWVAFAVTQSRPLTEADGAPAEVVEHVAAMWAESAALFARTGRSY